MKKLIEVTAEHIRKGSKWSCEGCPVALALESAGIEHLGVGSAGCEISWGNLIKLPRSVVRFIGAFDSDKPVKPFRFWFDTERTS